MGERILTSEEVAETKQCAIALGQSEAERVTLLADSHEAIRWELTQAKTTPWCQVAKRIEAERDAALARVTKLEAALRAIRNLTWDPDARGMGHALPRELTPEANRILRTILAAVDET